MAFKDESWNDPPYNATDGVRVEMKNGSHRYYWYTSKGQRNSRYKDLRKKVNDPRSNITDVSKAQRTIER